MNKKTIKDIFVKEKKIKPLKEELGLTGAPAGSRLTKFVVFVSLIAVLAGFGFVIFKKINRAEVNVSPHREKITIDSKLLAKKNSNEGLPFDTMKLEEEESKMVSATGVSSSSQKASGRIIIYNNYSSAAQKLIANTRFETIDGKIYRIQGSVVIPGNGSIEAIVYADKPGPDYNITGADFKLPGFKNSPRYAKIYAKTKNTISGGSSASSKFFKKEDLEVARSEMNAKIKEKLNAAFAKQKPEGYLFLTKALKIEYADDPDSPKAGNPGGLDSIFKIKGAGTAILVKKSDLEKALAADNAKKIKKVIDNSNIHISNLESLGIEIVTIDSGGNQAILRVKGDANFVWGFDKDKLVADLMGYSGKNYGEVFQKYPEIDKAEVIIRPAWWKKLPGDKARIKVTEAAA